MPKISQKRPYRVSFSKLRCFLIFLKTGKITKKLRYYVSLIGPSTVFETTDQISVS